MSASLYKYIPRKIISEDPILDSYIGGMSNAEEQHRQDLATLSYITDITKIPAKFLPYIAKSKGWFLNLDLSEAQYRKLIPNLEYILDHKGEVQIIIYTIKLLYGIELLLLQEEDNRWAYGVVGRSEYGLTTLYIFQKAINRYELSTGIVLTATQKKGILSIVNYLRCFGVEYSINSDGGAVVGVDNPGWFYGSGQYGIDTIYTLLYS